MPATLTGLVLDVGDGVVGGVYGDFGGVEGQVDCPVQRRAGRGHVIENLEDGCVWPADTRVRPFLQSGDHLVGVGDAILGRTVGAQEDVLLAAGGKPAAAAQLGGGGVLPYRGERRFG